MNRGLATHIKFLHTRTMTQIRKTLDDIVLDRRAGIGVTQDEMFVANSLPFDLLPGTEGMPLRENHEYLLGPQLQHFAIWHTSGCCSRKVRIRWRRNPAAIDEKMPMRK